MVTWRLISLYVSLAIGATPTKKSNNSNLSNQNESKLVDFLELSMIFEKACERGQLSLVEKMLQLPQFNPFANNFWSVENAFKRGNHALVKVFLNSKKILYSTALINTLLRAVNVINEVTDIFKGTIIILGSRFDYNIFIMAFKRVCLTDNVKTAKSCWGMDHPLNLMLPISFWKFVHWSTSKWSLSY